MSNKLSLAKLKKTSKPLASVAKIPPVVPNAIKCVSTIPLNRGYCPPNIAPALYFNTAKNIFKDDFGADINTVPGDPIFQNNKPITPECKVLQQENVQCQSKMTKDFAKLCSNDQQYTFDVTNNDASRHYNKSISPEVFDILENKIQTHLQKIESKKDCQQPEETKILFKKNQKTCQNNENKIEKKTKCKKRSIKDNNQKDRNYDVPVSDLCPLDRETMEILKGYILRIANDPAMELDRCIRDIIHKGLAKPNILKYFQQIMVTMPQINDYVRMTFLDRLSQYANNENLAQQMLDSTYNENDLNENPAGVLSVTQIYETRSTLDDLVRSIQRNGKLTSDEIVILKEKFRTLTHLAAYKRNIILKALYHNIYETKPDSKVYSVESKSIETNKLQNQNVLFPLQYIYDIVKEMSDINYSIKTILKSYCTSSKKTHNTCKMHDIYASLRANLVDFKENNFYFNPKSLFSKNCVNIDPYELAYLKQILAKQTINMVNKKKDTEMSSSHFSTIFAEPFSYEDFQYLKRFLLALSSYSRPQMMSLLQTLQSKANFTTENVDFLYNIAKQLPLDLSSPEHKKLINVLYDFGKDIFQSDPHLHYDQVAAAIDHYKNGDTSDLIAVGTKFMKMGERRRNDYLRDPKLQKLLTPSVLRSIKLLVDNQNYKPSKLRNIASLTKCFRTAIIRANREADMEIKDIVNILKRSTETPRANEAIRQLLRKFAQMNEKQIYIFFNQTYTQYLTVPTILIKLIKAVEKDEVYLSRRHAHLIENILNKFWRQCPEVRHDNINALDVKTLEIIAKELHPKRAEIYFKELKSKHPNTVSDYHKLALKLAHTDNALIKPTIRYLDDNRIKRFYEHMKTMINIDVTGPQISKSLSHVSMHSTRNTSITTASSIAPIIKTKKPMNAETFSVKRRVSKLTPRNSASAPSLGTRPSKTADTALNSNQQRKNSVTDKLDESESMQNYHLHLPADKTQEIIEAIRDVINVRRRLKKIGSSEKNNELEEIKKGADKSKIYEKRKKEDQKKNNKSDDPFIGKIADKGNVNKNVETIQLDSIKVNNIVKDKNNSSTNAQPIKKNKKKKIPQQQQQQEPEPEPELQERSMTSPIKILSNEVLSNDMSKNETLTIEPKPKASKIKKSQTKRLSSKENVKNLSENNDDITKSSEELLLNEKTNKNNQAPKKLNRSKSQDSLKSFPDNRASQQRRIPFIKKSTDEKQSTSKLSTSTINVSETPVIRNEIAQTKRALLHVNQQNKKVNEDAERFKAYKTLRALRHGALYKKKPFNAVDRHSYWTQDDILALFETGIHSIHRRPTYPNLNEPPEESPKKEYYPKHFIPTIFEPLNYMNALKSPNNELMITPSFISNMWRAGELNKFNVKQVIQEVLTSDTLIERQKEMLLKSLNDYAENPMVFNDILPKLRLAYYKPIEAHVGIKLLHPQSNRHPVNDPVYLNGAAKYCPSLRRTIITFWRDKKHHIIDDINDNFASNKKLKYRRRRSI